MARRRHWLLGLLLLAVLLCGGCRVFQAKPLAMQLDGFQVRNVELDEGAWKNDPAGGGAVAVLRWKFQTVRGTVRMDQSETWRYMVLLQLSAESTGKPAVQKAELLITSFVTGDQMQAEDLKADLSIDERHRLSGTLVGSWRWVGGRNTYGPLNCPRLGVFSARLTNVPYDPQKADALLTDYREQMKGIQPAQPEASP